MKTIGIKLADGSFYPVLKEGRYNFQDIHFVPDSAGLILHKPGQIFLYYRSLHKYMQEKIM